MNKFNVIIVEDVMLELRGTVEIFKNEIPEANIIGTAQNEEEFWARSTVLPLDSMSACWK